MMTRILSAILAALVACQAPEALALDVNGQLKKAQLEKLSADPTGSEARIYWNTADKKAKIYDGSGWTSVGSGAGEINLIGNTSDSSNWGTSSATASTTSSSGDIPLYPLSTTAISCASSTSGGYCRYRWTQPAGLKNRKLKVEWYQKLATTGDFKVEVYKNAASNYGGAYTEFNLSTDVSGDSSLPGYTGKYTSTFDADDGDYYELRVVRTASSAATLYLAGVIVGPGIQPQGALITAWTSYTIGDPDQFTTSSKTAYWRRVGDSIEIWAQMVISSAVSDQVFFGNSDLMPSSSITYDTSRIPTWSGVGQWYGRDLSAGSSADEFGGIVYYRSNLGIEFMTATDAMDATAPVTWANTDEFSFHVTLPVTEWRNSGTVALIQDETLTDWMSFTPTGSWSTNTTWTGRWRRVGSDMEIEAMATLAGAPDAASLNANLPTGYTIDTAALANTTSGHGVFGQATGFDSSASKIYQFNVSYATSSAVRIRNQVEGANVALQSDNVTASNPVTWATGDFIVARFKVPVLEWRGRNGGGLVGIAKATGSTLGLVKTSVGDQSLSVLSTSSTPTTLTTGDGYKLVLVTASTSAKVVNLPSAAANVGREITIKKVDGSTGGYVSIVCDGSDTIEGLYASTRIAYNTSGKGSFITLVSDGTVWRVLATNDVNEDVITSSTVINNSTTYVTFSNITIFPGTWDVTCTADIAGNASMTWCAMAISTNSGSSATTGTTPGVTFGQWPGVSSVECMAALHARISVTATAGTTYNCSLRTAGVGSTANGRFIIKRAL